MKGQNVSHHGKFQNKLVWLLKVPRNGREMGKLSGDEVEKLLEVKIICCAIMRLWCGFQHPIDKASLPHMSIIQTTM